MPGILYHTAGKELSIVLKHDLIDELFRKYYNEALLYTMSLCRNKAMAEDIVSEAFFKALGSADDSIRDFKPWLLAVCRNEFLMHSRKQSRISDTELHEGMSVQEDEILHHIIKREEYCELYRTISALADSQKEVIVLFYFNGLRVKGISEVIGKSEANVKVLLHRAREELRKNMEVLR